MDSVWFNCTEPIDKVQEGSRRFDAVEPLRTRVQVSYTVPLAYIFIENVQYS